jgi:glycosyltransferase involved in cell wall biosynthesis
MKPLTIVIPNRAGETPKLTIDSLFRQNWQEFDIIIINDFSGNANKARNEGLWKVSTKYVLFSDNDINWQPSALFQMFDCLEKNRDISFAWGSYELNGKVSCHHPWDPAELRRRNYISTMTMVRTADHPGWDESIRRLQDWDVWLAMMAKGRTGKYIGQRIFTTPVRDGITRNSISYEEAFSIIKKKHNL